MIKSNVTKIVLSTIFVLFISFIYTNKVFAEFGNMAYQSIKPLVSEDFKADKLSAKDIVIKIQQNETDLDKYLKNYRNNIDSQCNLFFTFYKNLSLYTDKLIDIGSITYYKDKNHTPKEGDVFTENGIQYKTTIDDEKVRIKIINPKINSVIYVLGINGSYEPIIDNEYLRKAYFLGNDLSKILSYKASFDKDIKGESYRNFLRENTYKYPKRKILTSWIKELNMFLAIYPNSNYAPYVNNLVQQYKSDCPKDWGLILFIILSVISSILYAIKNDTTSNSSTSSEQITNTTSEQTSSPIQTNSDNIEEKKEPRSFFKKSIKNGRKIDY